MLLLLTATFIGSQACRACHRELTESYARTPMARSSGKADTLPSASFSAAGHRYRIEGGQLIFNGGSQSMDYFIGSSSAGRSYLSEHDGYLFEVPVTWYAQKQEWDASPGYERDAAVRLNRGVELSCLLCHASRVRPVRDTQNRYGAPPFLDEGVGCERCHGPGSDHALDPAGARMINPARLEPDRRDSVCSQCHLTGEARVERAGMRFAAFQAGERLADYATYFVWDTDSRNMKVTSHAEKLAASACKRAAGDALWCGTCHEPHTNANKTQAACLACHSKPHRADQVCATCHMPKSRVADDGGHGVLTDHSIPRVARLSAAPPTSDLKVFLGSGDDRSFGIAYAQLGDSRARELLRRALPADAEVQLRLAAIDVDETRSEALYESVLKLDPAQPVALVNLGAIYARQGKVREAAALWERALVVNPGIEAAVINLSEIRPPDEARALLKRYLLLNPVSAAARTRLSLIH